MLALWKPTLQVILPSMTSTNCDRIRRARQWSAVACIEYKCHDYRTHPLRDSALQTWTIMLSWKNLLNKRSTTWLKLNSALQGNAPKLLVNNSSMLKQPLITKDGQNPVGFTAATYAHVFAFPTLFPGDLYEPL